jgi:hypothetical protein
MQDCCGVVWGGTVDFVDAGGVGNVIGLSEPETVTVVFKVIVVSGDFGTPAETGQPFLHPPEPRVGHGWTSTIGVVAGGGSVEFPKFVSVTVSSTE